MGEEKFTCLEMSAAHLTDKGLCAEHTKIKQQEQKRTPKKWQKGVNRQFTGQDTQPQW